MKHILTLYSSILVLPVLDWEKSVLSLKKKKKKESPSRSEEVLLCLLPEHHIMQDQQDSIMENV